jgi:mRNA-degrading endonuclease toxin of MazEF toxin-antitoxin module
VSVPEPLRGDVWSFLPTVAGRDKPSSLGADRVLVISNSTANALLPTVLALPVVTDAPRMPALAVELSADDPLPGCSVVVYQAKPVYRPWLVERIGSVTEATLHSVFTVMVGYLDR